MASGAPPRKPPRIWGMLGFDEEDWAVFQQLKVQAGSVQEVIAEVRKANEKVERGLLQIDVMNEVMFKVHPEEYKEACRLFNINAG